MLDPKNLPQKRTARIVLLFRISATIMILLGIMRFCSPAARLNETINEISTPGSSDRAVVKAVKLLQASEQSLGPEHPDVVGKLRDLGLMYVAKGQYEQAEPLFRRALAINEKAHPDSPFVAIDMNNLAELYCKQSKYAQAELLYKRSLAIWERAFGTDHCYP